MADVCIYTANYGGYDTPRGHVEQDIDVDWRYFTDDGRVRDEACSLGWAAYQMGGAHPQPMMAAKWWKMTPPNGYEYRIWIDANMEVTSASFVSEAIAALDGRAFAVWKHPRRDDLHDEICASLGAEAQDGKYADCADRMIEQGRAYEMLGMPRHAGLYACGTIVWTDAAGDVAASWWTEVNRWSYQDQVSLPFVCWCEHMWPAVFPVPQIDRRYQRAGKPYLANRWLRIWPHG